MDPTQAPQAPTLPQYQDQQPPAQQVPIPNSQPPSQQPQPQQQPQEPAQPHPDFARPPARQGEQRVAALQIPPEEWTAMQGELRTLKEFKNQQDQILEMKEQERIRVMAEKGQIEEALNQSKAMYERKSKLLEEQLAAREKAWLDEKLEQTINRAMMGRMFIGKDEAARARTAALVRKSLALELEAKINPTTGQPLIQDRTTLRPADDYLKERLDSPDSEYNALLAPVRPSGGSGTDGARPPATTMSAPPPQLSPEETIRAWQAPTQQPIPAFGLAPVPRRA